VLHTIFCERTDVTRRFDAARTGDAGLAAPAR
jgi:hypothetical protein